MLFRSKDANDNAPPSAIADSALASHDSGGSRVYFIGKDPTSGDDHVYEIAWLGSIWNYTPLTTVTGAPSAIAGSALASHDSGGSRVYFIGNDNHVHELAWANQQGQWLWNTTDLTSVARDIHNNPPPQPIASSALTSHNTSADPGGSRVYFISSDNHVHEIAWVGGRLVGTPPT